MDSDKHRRRSIRLPAYDYAQPGAYFVTLVTHHRQHLFGRIEGEAMKLNAFGRVVADCWQEIPAHFPSVSNAIFVVMPNHFHGIVEIQEEIGGDDGARHASPVPNCFHGIVEIHEEMERAEEDIVVAGGEHASPVRNGVQPNSLGAIIGSFKSAVSRKIHQVPGCEEIRIWLRNYYEHVIRDQGEYERVATYIHANPANWAADREGRQW